MEPAAGVGTKVRKPNILLIRKTTAASSTGAAFEETQSQCKRVGVALSRCASGSLQCRQFCSLGNRIRTIVFQRKAACNNNSYYYCCFCLGSQTRMHFWICYREKLKNASHRQSSKKLHLKPFFFRSTSRGDGMTLVIMWLLLDIFLKAFILIISPFF